MKKIILIVIPIGLILVFLFPFLGGSLYDDFVQSSSTDYLKNAPIVNVTGTLYNWQPKDGLSYSIVIDHDVVGVESGSNIHLTGSGIYNHVGGEIIQVHGTFIENYRDYKSSSGMGISSGDENSPAILVDKITVIKSPGEAILLTGIVHYEEIEGKDIFILEPDSEELYKLEKTARGKVILEDSLYNFGEGIDSNFVRHFDGQRISVDGYVKTLDGKYELDLYSNLPIIAVKYAKSDS